jgi:hypothetical protein
MGFWSEIFDAVAKTTTSTLTLGPLAPLGLIRDTADMAAAEDLPEDRNAIVRAVNAVMHGAGAAAGAVAKVATAPAEWATQEVLEPAYDWVTFQPRRAMVAARLARARAVEAGHEPGGVLEWTLFYDPQTWEDAAEIAENTSLGQAFTELLGSSTLVREDSAVFHATGAANFENRFAPTEEEIRRLRESHPGYNITSGAFDFAARWYLDPLMMATKAGRFVRLRRVRPIQPGEDIAAAFELEGADVPDGRLRRLWYNFSRGENIYQRVSKLWSEETKSWGPFDFILASDAVAKSSNPVAFGWALAEANQFEGAVRVETMKLVLRTALGDAKALAELRERRPVIADALLAAQDDFDAAKAELLYERGLSKDPQLLLFDQKLRPLVGNFEDNPLVRKVRRQRYRMLKQRLEQVQREADFRSVLEKDVFGVARGSVPTINRRGAKRIERKFPVEFEYRASPWSTPVRWIRYGRDEVDSLLNMRANGFIHLDAPDSYRELDAYFTLARRLFKDNISPEAHRAFLNRYTKARTPIERMAVVEKAEQYALKRIAANYGIPQEFAVELFKRLQQERSRLFGSRERIYSAAPSPDPLDPMGTTADMVYSDGAYVHLPILSTQQPNIVPMSDLAELKRLMDKEAARVRGLLRQLQEQGATLKEVLDGTVAGTAKYRASLSDLVFETLDRYSSFWKLTTLLRPSYPMRSILESNLRSFASFRSAALLAWLEGTRNFVSNLANRGKNGRIVAEHIFEERMRLELLRDQLEVLEEQYAKAPKRKKRELKVEVERARGSLREQQAKVERLSKAKTSEIIEELGLKKELGANPFKVPGGGTFEGPFDSPEGAFRKTQTAANGMYWRLYLSGRGDEQARGELLRRMAERGDAVEQWRVLMNWSDPKTYLPSDREHSAVWQRIINFQFRNDPLIMGSGNFPGLIGGATTEEAIRWLRLTPEGQAHWRSIPPQHRRDIERFVNGVRSTVDYYLPTQDLRNIVRDRELTLGDIEAHKAVRGNPVPMVHGPSVEATLGRGKTPNLWTRTIGTWLDYISSGPETKLARHPHYVIAYREAVRKEIDYLLKDPNRKLLGLDDKILIEELEGHIKQRAHQAALKNLKETLYDASERSNAAHLLRWASPFLAAHQDALSVWWRLVKDDPRLLGWANLLWMFPAKAGVVIDEDGNLVKGRDYADTDRVILALPAWAGGPTERDPDRGVFTIMDSRATISLDTMNVVFPGSPWWSPGVGPLVTIPLSWYRKQQPGIDKYVSWMDPYGPIEGGALGYIEAAFLPPWAQRAAGLILGKNDHQYAGYVNWMYMTDLAEWHLNGQIGPEPTPEEAAEKVNVLYGLKIASLLGSPFQVNFQSKYQFAQDAYNNLQDEAQRRGLGEEWVFEQFREKYHDALMLMASGTGKNNAGLVTSPEAIAAKEKYQHIINSYNPRFAAGIVGTEGQIGEWNPSAQARVYEEPIVEGGSIMWRERRGTEEVVQANYARIGWHDYRQIMNLIEAYAEEHGLRTYRESPALVQLRAAVIAELKEQNPYWWEEYDSGRESFDRNLLEIAKIAEDKRWLDYPERNDIVTLREYLALRRMFEQQLEERRRAGGDKTMQAKSNSDLRKLWTLAVGELVERDITFADSWFYRYLEYDPWLDDALLAEEVTTSGAGG